MNSSFYLGRLAASYRAALQESGDVLVVTAVIIVVVVHRPVQIGIYIGNILEV